MRGMIFLEEGNVSRGRRLETAWEKGSTLRQEAAKDEAAEANGG